MSDSTPFSIEVLSAGGLTALGAAAAALSPGDSAEFDSAGATAFAANGGELFVYWNNKFYWDDVEREAQIIGIGTTFDPCSHALYIDSAETWHVTLDYNPATYWGTTGVGHPYEWHVMTPDGTYWCKRASNENALQYRRRVDWSQAPWALHDKTPTFVSGDSSYPESIEWHEEMGRAIFRYSGNVTALDLMKFIQTGVWEYEELPISPSVSSGSPPYSAMRYCRALKAMICWGRNDGTAQDNQYLIDANGAMTTLANKPPRWVNNGNRSYRTAPENSMALYVDDPLGQHAYLIGVQPTGSTEPNQVWRMANTGQTWDGTWTLIGETDAFIKPRADGQAIGDRIALCAIPCYGVVWVLRQSNVQRMDSFLWKPPTV